MKTAAYRARNDRPARFAVVSVLLALSLLSCRTAEDNDAKQGSEPKWVPSASEIAEMQRPVARAVETAHREVLDRPDSAEAWGKLGMVCDAHHLYAEAQENYRRASELDPENFYWTYLFAVVSDFLGADHDVVSRAFERAMAISPRYPPAPLRYGDALVRLGHLNEARAAYEKAIRLDPDFAMAHRGLGQVLLATGDNVTALVHLERAAALEPTDGVVHSSLARAYRLSGNEDRAAEAMRRSRDLAPVHSVPDPVRYEVEQLAVDSRTLLQRYPRAMRRGAWEVAIRDLEFLLETFPNQARYGLDLAMSYDRSGRHEEGIQQYRQALELSDTTELRRGLAEALIQLGDYAEAKTHLRAALKLNPQDVEARYLLGFTCEFTGGEEEAMRHYRQVVETRPDHPAARRLDALENPRTLTD